MLVLFGVLASYVNPLVDVVDSWRDSRAEFDRLDQVREENRKLKRRYEGAGDGARDGRRGGAGEADSGNAVAAESPAGVVDSDGPGVDPGAVTVDPGAVTVGEAGGVSTADSQAGSHGSEPAVGGQPGIEAGGAGGDEGATPEPAGGGNSGGVVGGLAG